MKPAEDGYSKKNIGAVLKAKDKEISDLKIKLSSHVSCSSNLQNRLISTLDTLDAVQASAAANHQREAELVKLLRSEITAYRDTIRQLEEEKDDLKDAVLKLIRRGETYIRVIGTAAEHADVLAELETSNDYSNWPRSRLHISAPLPAEVVTDKGKHARALLEDVDANQVDTYTTALIKHLSTRLSQERRASEALQKESQTRIMALEAQVARREAEIESLIQDFPKPKSPGTSSSISNKTPPKLSQEEAIRILEISTVRNRDLEAEIRTLANQLEHAKEMAARQMPGSSGKQNPFRSSQTITDDNLSQEDSGYHINEDAQLALGSLREEVNHLGKSIDALAEERGKHSSKIRRLHSSQKRQTQPSDDFENILLLEAECIRLSKRESNLLAELEQSKWAAHQREYALRQEIQHLLYQNGLNAKSPEENSSPNVRSSLSTFPALIPIPETPEKNNPELIPLPLSPLLSPPDEEDISLINLELQTTGRVNTPRNINDIEWELEDARREVTETGHAIEELRENIIQLTEYQRHM